MSNHLGQYGILGHSVEGPVNRVKFQIESPMYNRRLAVELWLLMSLLGEKYPVLLSTKENQRGGGNWKSKSRDSARNSKLGVSGKCAGNFTNKQKFGLQRHSKDLHR